MVLSRFFEFFLFCRPFKFQSRLLSISYFMQVWSVVRQFGEPQIYKPFVQRCSVQGEVKEGCIREVHVVSGLPVTTSIERLDTLDDKNHVLIYTVLGGDHRLKVDLFLIELRFLLVYLKSLYLLHLFM